MRDDLECCNVRRGEDSGREIFGQCSQHILVKSGNTGFGGAAHSHRVNVLLHQPLHCGRIGDDEKHLLDWVLRWIRRLMCLFVVKAKLWIQRG